MWMPTESCCDLDPLEPEVEEDLLFKPQETRGDAGRTTALNV